MGMLVFGKSGSLAARNDDAVVLAFMRTWLPMDLRLAPQLDILEHHLVRPGVLTDQAPTQNSGRTLDLVFHG